MFAAGVSRTLGLLKAKTEETRKVKTTFTVTLTPLQMEGRVSTHEGSAPAVRRKITRKIKQPKKIDHSESFHCGMYTRQTTLLTPTYDKEPNVSQLRERLPLSIKQALTPLQMETRVTTKDRGSRAPAGRRCKITLGSHREKNVDHSESFYCRDLHHSLRKFISNARSACEPTAYSVTGALAAHGADRVVGYGEFEVIGGAREIEELEHEIRFPALKAGTAPALRTRWPQSKRGINPNDGIHAATKEAFVIVANTGVVRPVTRNGGGPVQYEGPTFRKSSTLNKKTRKPADWLAKGPEAWPLLYVWHMERAPSGENPGGEDVASPLSSFHPIASNFHPPASHPSGSTSPSSPPKKMDYVPPTYSFSLPRRGRVAEIDLDITEALFDEYRRAAHARNARSHSPSAEDDSDSDSENSTPDATARTDPDYIPPRMKIWSNAPQQPQSPYALRPRAPRAGLSPFPEAFSRGHLRSLNFRFLKWHDQPGVLVDLRDRIGAMYFGSPVETLEWQRTVIQAGHDMLDARTCASQENALPVDALASGICSEGYRGNRPQNMRQNVPISDADIALAFLRDAPAIRRVACFQNTVLEKVAPRLWTSANDIIDSVLKHDSGLHLPFYSPNSTGAPLTAFARVDYQFSTTGVPQRAGDSYVPGLTALTSLGNYDATEGELILWSEEAVINFPMILSQTCEHGLSEFVDNDFSGTYAERETNAGDWMREARAGAALCGTLNEYDKRYENELYE
ncbi:hypothetical protein C8R46DRAFT_1033683 [Mycena filopes]|nr:hypothetical protein C8R46DRAFT_1033683 [Mycena filopes]